MDLHLTLGDGDVALLVAMVSSDVTKQAEWAVKVLRKALNRQPDSNLIKEFTDDFYPNYPRHEAPGAARTAYIRARGKTDAGTILRGLAAYCVAVRGKEKKFICLPATWLNQERWADEREPDPIENKPKIDPWYAERSKLETYLKTGRWFGRGSPESLPRELLIKYAAQLREKGVQVPIL